MKFKVYDKWLDNWWTFDENLSVKDEKDASIFDTEDEESMKLLAYDKYFEKSHNIIKIVL